jgi:tRNA(Arg) A34 adenosine deaminase TadA
MCQTKPVSASVHAVLALNDKIISLSHNRVEEMQDATAHAEMLCLQEASKLLGTFPPTSCYLCPVKIGKFYGELSDAMQST